MDRDRDRVVVGADPDLVLEAEGNVDLGAGRAALGGRGQPCLAAIEGLAEGIAEGSRLGRVAVFLLPGHADHDRLALALDRAVVGILHPLTQGHAEFGAGVDQAGEVLGEGLACVRVLEDHRYRGLHQGFAVPLATFGVDLFDNGDELADLQLETHLGTSWSVLGLPVGVLAPQGRSGRDRK